MGRARLTREEVRARRERAVRLLKRGFSQAEVARRLGVSRQSTSRWNRALAQGGAAGLQAGKPGRRPRVTAAQLKRIARALEKGARAHGWRTDVWTLERVGTLIWRLTGVRYHTGHVWRVLRGLGLSRRRPGGREVRKRSS